MKYYRIRYSVEGEVKVTHILAITPHIAKSIFLESNPDAEILSCKVENTF